MSFHAIFVLSDTGLSWHNTQPRPPDVGLPTFLRWQSTRSFRSLTPAKFRSILFLDLHSVMVYEIYYCQSSTSSVCLCPQKKTENRPLTKLGDVGCWGWRYIIRASTKWSARHVDLLNQVSLHVHVLHSRNTNGSGDLEWFNELKSTRK